MWQGQRNARYPHVNLTVEGSFSCSSCGFHEPLNPITTAKWEMEAEITCAAAQAQAEAFTGRHASCASEQPFCVCHSGSVCIGCKPGSHHGGCAREQVGKP